MTDVSRKHYGVHQQVFLKMWGNNHPVNWSYSTEEHRPPNKLLLKHKNSHNSGVVMCVQTDGRKAGMRDLIGAPRMLIYVNTED